MSLEACEHFNSARAVYEFVAEIAPKNPEALKRAGAMMYHTGDHAKALEYYERALAADPRDQEALKARKNLAAETALSRSKTDGIQHSRELIKDKDEARTLERRQRLHLSDDELREELGRLEGRFADAPSDPELMLAMAEVHEKLKDPEAALELAERALQYRSGSFELVCRVGDLKSKVLKKRLRQADKDQSAERAGRLEAELLGHEVEDYRRRLEVRPGDATLRMRFAMKLMRVDDVDGALAELQRCQSEPRVRDEALFLLGQCFQRKGILDLARKEYEQALAATKGVDERAKEILYNLGTIAETRGARDEARSFYIRIYEVDIGYRDVAEKMSQLS